MSRWDSLSSREMWDLIDEVYLNRQLKLEELLGILQLRQEEYLSLRKTNAPVPRNAAENFFKTFGQEFEAVGKS